jgi:hypothetical protein
MYLYKVFFSATAIALLLVAYYPYIQSVLRRQTKPHVFSWLIWGLTTSIAFFAQLADDAGIGAWPTAISGTITLYVAFLAYQHRSDNTIAPIDWVFFIMALSSLPLWYFTENPFWAILILTITDLLGFMPTFRKAYISPYEEQLTFFALMAIRNCMAIAALEHYSATTILFPASIVVTCSCFVIMVSIRRSMLQPSLTSKNRA